jgi:hypothetical protein
LNLRRDFPTKMSADLGLRFGYGFFLFNPKSKIQNLVAASPRRALRAFAV